MHAAPANPVIAHSAWLVRNESTSGTRPLHAGPHVVGAAEHASEQPRDDGDEGVDAPAGLLARRIDGQHRAEPLLEDADARTRHPQAHEGEPESDGPGRQCRGRRHRMTRSSLGSRPMAFLAA